MASSLPLQVAETIQTAHINTNPSPEHDINPSTAASKKEPVVLEEEKQPYAATDTSVSEQSRQRYASLFQQSLLHPGHKHEPFRDDIDDDEAADEGRDDEEAEIPFSILRAKPRRRQQHHLPPIPDLRYEQSYLHSIRNADTWWKVAWITTRDQVMMPFAQGILYNLAIGGWQYWNRNARIHGSSLGARIRRWWYGVNNWALPPPPKNKYM